MDWKRSSELFEQSLRFIPGGVNSPVRSGKAVGVDPIFIREAKGCRITDVDGNSYIEYVGSWGPLIAGHAPSEVIEAICAAAGRGTSYGIPTELELRMARKVCELVPSIEMVRMVSSGTEATMSAIRLARGFTGRDRIIKFSGCYHGHSDMLLAQGGSGLLTLSIPGTPGIPADVVRNTTVCQYNDLDSVAAVMREIGGEIAAIIVEPIPANMGVILPLPGFLGGLRELCDRHDALLIFDEVITGFRIGTGGAQEKLGIMPDMTCLGKIIGGGLPVGAFGGRREIMAELAPSGPVYQAGTLSGNPVAMSAGLAMLEILTRPGVYEKLEEKTAYFAAGMAQAAIDAGVRVCWNRCGSMGTGFFNVDKVESFTDAMLSDTGAYGLFFSRMLARGFYFAPSQFEAFFVGLAHTTNDLDATIAAAREVFAEVAATRATLD